MNRAKSYSILVALGGAALMAFCIFAFNAPIDMSDAVAVGLLDLKTCGFLLGLGAVVGGALYGLCAK